jgi:hypothetical protein
MGKELGGSTPQKASMSLMMQRPRIMKVVLRSYAVTANRLSLSFYAWRECGSSSLPLLRLSGDEATCFALLNLEMKTGAQTLVVSFLSKGNSVARGFHLSALLLEWALPDSSQRLG